MAVTIPALVTRFTAPQLSKWYVVPTIAGFAAGTGATLAELGAATDITADLIDTTGFTVSAADIATPDWGKRFVGSIPGRITADASGMMFYLSATGADYSSIFTLGLNTYLARFLNGAVTGSRTDYYKVTVSKVTPVVVAEDVAKLDVGFSVRATLENQVYPTS